MMSTRKPPANIYAFNEDAMLAGIRAWNEEHRHAREAARREFQRKAGTLRLAAIEDPNVAVKVALRKPVVLPATPPRRAKEVLDVVCSQYAVSRHELLRRSNKSLAVRRRYIAMFALRALGYSLPVIGRVVNTRHSTVIAGLERVEVCRAQEPEFATCFEAVMSALGIAIAALHESQPDMTSFTASSIARAA
jgi:chromosomal replication initiation ATPase DnaA